MLTNIELYNILRATDRKIALDVQETISIVKHGYPCIPNCTIRHQCGNRKATCNWDLRAFNPTETRTHILTQQPK